MDREQVLIFGNPIAGRGRGREVASQLRQRLVHEGYEAHLFLSPAESIDWQPQAGRPVRATVVIGGDGTLRRVAAWAVERTWGVDGAGLPPLLVVPMGTANLMGRHLGISWHRHQWQEQLVEALRQRRVIQLDAARTQDGLFLIVAGVGIDAQIVHELSHVRHGPIRISSYLGPALRALTSYTFAPLKVRVDGQSAIDGEPAMVFVGNVPEYGTGFPMLPQARADDGLLDVCIIPCDSKHRLAELLIMAAAGQHLKAKGVLYAKARRIEVHSPQAVPVQVDGEPAGHTPVAIDLLPQKIGFIVPHDPQLQTSKNPDARNPA